MKAIPRELRCAHKTYPGYEVIYSTHKLRPVTGREWTYTATDDQVNVLLDIERLWQSFEGTRFHYVFREIHDDKRDGWTLTIYDKNHGKTHWKFFPGFPGSATQVLQALQLLYKQTVEDEARDDG